MENLIIHSNKETLRHGLIFIPILLIICSFNYVMIPSLFQNILPDFLIFITKTIIICFSGFLLIGLVIGITFIFFQTYNDEPAAVLNEKGIWVKYFGFIPWQDITEFKTYTVGNCPIESIGIRVKDIDKLSQQSSFSGKSGIFWSRITGYPPINLSNLAIPHNRIMWFARQFLKEN